MIPLHKNIPEHSPLKVTHRVNKEGNEARIVEDLIAHKRYAHKRFKSEVKLFFSLGLAISLLLVIVVFEWKSYDKIETVDITSTAFDTEEILDIPVTEQPPPPPQKVIQQPNIIEVTEEEIIEEIEVDFDVEITTEEAVAQTEEMVLDDAPEEEFADEIFTIVEEQPTPVGGMNAFMTFIHDKLRYPASAARMGVEGRVFVQFVVNKDGQLTDFTVVKGIGGGCDEEALRVLKSAPPWNPGKQRGHAVRVRMIIPIHFALREL